MPADRYDHGTFCWADVATTDEDGAKIFYAALFGWGSKDNNTGQAGVYTLLRLNARNVAGMRTLTEGERGRGSAPHWHAYVAVDSCDKTVRRAQELGGSVVAAPFDIPDAGRMAVIRDPQGAVLALWQRDNPHPGAAKLGPVPGTVCWNELTTTDPAAASAFYTGLLGWTCTISSLPVIPYNEFLVDDRPVGGMLQMTDEWGGAHPHWLVYFLVADCGAAAAQARDLGGTVLREPFDLPNAGCIAVCADPQGAAFAIITKSATT